MRDHRPDPFFIADATALDFLNTVAAPTGRTIEWIEGGRDLLAWLRKVDAVPALSARALSESAVLGELDQVAAQARELREWFRDFVHAHKGRPVGASAETDLEPINRLLARDEFYGSVAPARLDTTQEGRERGSFTWIWHRRFDTPESLLQPIAHAMANLLCEADFTHVKQCEGPGCTLLFHDVTKSRARRWCSMAVCGNRAKQAAHRERVRRKTEGAARKS